MSMPKILEQMKNKSDAPIGSIIVFSGDIIPESWALCDGTNGTPDLRDKFIIGAGGSYTIGDTGGNKEITLTEEQLPSHSHEFIGEEHSHDATTSLSGVNAASNGAHTHTVALKGISKTVSTYSVSTTSIQQVSTNNNTTSSSNGAHTHSLSGTPKTTVDSATVGGTVGNTGSSEAIDITPPYYALCYIMKIK